jgi:hypothetical protein
MAKQTGKEQGSARPSRAQGRRTFGLKLAFLGFAKAANFLGQADKRRRARAKSERAEKKKNRRRCKSYLQALELVHNSLKPRSYVEIGCGFGNSLKLANCVAIGIDPVNKLTGDLGNRVRFFQETSDYFFQARSVRDLLGCDYDLGFIDGMHLVEYALRDFINMEANGHKQSVIVVDDTLPEKNEFAVRVRAPSGGAWTGDVYRLLSILKEYRPDLRITVFDIAKKGFTIVDHLDPASTVLREKLPGIVARIEARDFVVSDVAELRTLHAVLPASELEPFLSNAIQPFS